jgi:uncharacterized membrane protein YkvA (DUF1232 family)
MNEKSQEQIFSSTIKDWVHQEDMNNFSEKKLFSKIRKVFKLAGRGVIEKIMLLYVLFIDPDIPKNIKLIIFSGLTYFILPFDAIPDFLVGIGYTDDLSVALGIIYMLSKYITDEHKSKSRELTNKLFNKH